LPLGTLSRTVGTGVHCDSRHDHEPRASYAALAANCQASVTVARCERSHVAESRRPFHLRGIYHVDPIVLLGKETLQRATPKVLIGTILLLVLAGSVTRAAYLRAHESVALARAHFIEESSDETHRDMERLNTGFRSIYENLRTLASLPGVATLDRHASNMSPEALWTFQQIYNNLASNVSVSEVYVVPIDFAPDHIDPVTSKPEEPIVMFDQLIVGAGRNMRSSALTDTSGTKQSYSAGNYPPSEIETFEYRQLKEHAAWMRQHYPRRERISGLAVPIISGSEIITCDNTLFVNTGLDGDRAGVMFSVPFYDTQGNLKGMITAIMLSKALAKLLPTPTSALINTENGYIIKGTGLATLDGSKEAIARGAADSNLAYSEVLSPSTQDSRHPWVIWAGLPNSVFDQSDAVTSIWQNFYKSLFAIGTLTSLLLAVVALLVRTIEQGKSLQLALQVSKQSENEAKIHVAELDSLNAKISEMNSDLAQNISALHQAHEEIVQKGKLAQLGQLVATVAHEIRNPLGTVRTTVFLLKKRLSSSDEAIARAFDRVENGVARCDGIITQLLDFSRTSRPVLKAVNADDWLANILGELAPALPCSLSIRCELGAQGISVNMDPDRMHRVITNFINNATEAMIDAKSGAPLVDGSHPCIAVETIRSERGFEISIEDNGPGIAPEVLAKIRDPLFTTKSFGTGLGIPAAEKMIELHGGKLDITSAVGKGSRFSFYIPDLALAA
jgi:signal transduction histidine kinase